MRRARSTLFMRLATATIALITCAIGVAVLFLYARFESLNGRFREGTLRSVVHTLGREVVRATIRSGGPPGGPIVRQVAEDGGLYVLVRQDGSVVAGSPGLAAPLMTPPLPEERFFLLHRPGGEPYYGLSKAVHGTEPPLVLQVAFPNGPIIFDSVLEEFIQDIAWIWVPFLGGMIVVNLLVVRVALRPLRLAAQQAESIGPGSVGVRLSEGALPADVLVLVQAVNRTLARLQQGYIVLEQFVGDVAHELRTPLAIMKTQVAVAGGAASGILADDLARMERLVEQLLDRVRLGGLHVEADDIVDLSAVAREVTTMLGPVALARGLSMELTGADRPVLVPGLHDYVYRALRNLIENALMHAPKGSTVAVGVGGDGSLAVADRGSGFPSELLAPGALRSREFRSGREDGIGLGLSIVDRTMAAHGGELDLRNAAYGGAIATMRFRPDRHVAPPEMFLVGNSAAKRP